MGNFIGNGAKFDNLNGGRMKQEYLDELEEARQDAYDHTVTFSDGFNEWMADRFKNQHKERMEEVHRIENHMFLKKDPHPMDVAIRERMAGSEKAVQYRNRIGSSLFSEDEIRRRHEDQENNRHPMDIAIRNRYEDRNAKKKA